MRRWRPGALLFMLLMLDAALACAAPVELTEQERLWIAQHPVLRVGVMENLVPFEYMSNGVLQGRPVQYLQYVRDATGLEFTYVPVKTRAARERMLLDGQVDLLSSHFRFRDEPPIEDLTALVYDTTVPIIVTRVDDADIFDLDQLQDKTVVIPDVEYYEQLLRKRAPRATLIKSPQALAMLNTLRDGGADAVVASEAFLMPYLYRQFQGVLEISGVVGSSMLDVNMAVRTDNAMLASIIGKALGSISPSQQNAMYEHWYRDLEVDAPTLWGHRQPLLASFDPGHVGVDWLVCAGLSRLPPAAAGRAERAGKNHVPGGDGSRNTLANERRAGGHGAAVAHPTQ
jgi:two-component system, NarL family, sensor histidine kinase EvgS